MKVGDEVILIEDEDANGDFTGKERKVRVVAQPVQDGDSAGMWKGAYDGVLLPTQDTNPSEGVWVKFLDDEQGPLCQLVEDGLGLWCNLQYGGGYEYYKIKRGGR